VVYKDVLNRPQTSRDGLTLNFGVWLEAIRTSVNELITLATELRTDHATTKATVDACRTAIIELIDDHATNKTTIDECRTAIIELIDDHATFKTVVDEVTAWAEALATKMNSDGGITDTDYDAVITADAPATLTAGDPTASAPTLTAPDPAAGPATITAAVPTAVPATLA
jgi:hypothetical protein